MNNLKDYTPERTVGRDTRTGEEGAQAAALATNLYVDHPLSQPYQFALVRNHLTEIVNKKPTEVVTVRVLWNYTPDTIVTAKMIPMGNYQLVSVREANLDGSKVDRGPEWYAEHLAQLNDPSWVRLHELNGSVKARF